MTDDIKMAKRRNVITALAYFILASLAACFTVGASFSIMPSLVCMLIFEILVGICGVILLILGKRDLTATVLLMFALLFGYYMLTGGVIYSIATPVILVFFIIVAIMMLTTGEKKASTYFCVFLPYGIGAISAGFFGSISVVTLIMHTIFGLVALFYAIMLLSCGKSKMAKNLQSDEKFSFKVSGSVLGYVILMIPFGVTAVSSLTTLAQKVDVSAMLIVSAFSLMIAGILLIVFARILFKPLLYILCGIVLAVFVLLDENTSLYIIPGICLIVIGLLFLVQKDGRILHFLLFALPGILLILIQTGDSSTLKSALLTGISALIAVYLALTYFSQRKKLPRF